MPENPNRPWQMPLSVHCWALGLFAAATLAVVYLYHRSERSTPPSAGAQGRRLPRASHTGQNPCQEVH